MSFTDSMIDDGFSDPMDYMDHLESQFDKWCEEQNQSDVGDYDDCYPACQDYDENEEE